MGDRSVGGWRARIRPVRLQRIQELSETGWVVQKQPANHCLKSCRHSINRGIAAPRAATGTVATSTHQVELMVIKQRLKLLESPGLSIGTDLIHNRTMQNICAAGAAAMTQALMQLPDRIAQPGELERTEFITTAGAGPPVDPVAQAAS